MGGQQGVVVSPKVGASAVTTVVYYTTVVLLHYKAFMRLHCMLRQ